MGRHLIVDDLEWPRHVGFRELLQGHKLDHAYTVTEAVLFMRERYIFAEPPEHYDVIFLDHDIEHGHDKREVIHFVRWILASDVLCEVLRRHGTKFFIHSHNPVGAPKMRDELLAAGFSAVWREFEYEPKTPKRQRSRAVQLRR